jgi:transposase-like protein
VRKRDFDALLARLQTLTPAQRKQLVEAVQGLDRRHEVALALEEQLGTPVCPRCGSEGVERWGRAAGIQRFRCREPGCRRTFNALTGTPLARLRQKALWLDYCEALVDGLSVRKAAKRSGVHRTTAFRWRHRFLAMPRDVKPSALQGRHHRG